MVGIGKCFVCKEDILDFEESGRIVISNRTLIYHKRPGCMETAIEIKALKKPIKCLVCGNNTDNLVFIAGTFLFACKGECDKIISERLIGEKNRSSVTGTDKRECPYAGQIAKSV